MCQKNSTFAACKGFLLFCMRKIGLLIVVLIAFCCCQRNGKEVCGVAVKGTPHELAAAISDKGDGSFLVESVEVYEQKAYIRGWLRTAEASEPYDDGLVPAEVVCDVTNGKVTDAFLYSKFLDRE